MLSEVISAATCSEIRPIPPGLHVFPIHAAAAQEFYILGTPDRLSSVEQLMEAACDFARSHHARICRLRAFVPQGEFENYQSAQRRAFASLDHDVPAQYLCSGTGSGALQFYAVAGGENWVPLIQNGRVMGWSFQNGATRYALTGGVTGDLASTRTDQARGAFLAGEELLDQAGMSLHHVARTWIYMRDILSWYGDLNAIRNELFIDRGLLFRGQPAGQSPVPASTGMGISPAENRDISISFYAASGTPLYRLAAAGRQHAAYEYGSAFARAAELATPAGQTLFISGTAAIDADGRTCCIDDIDGQIAITLENITAILDQRDFATNSVVEAIAYCKKPQVAQAFLSRFRDTLPWPWVIVIGDICRSDLLFEAEVTAARPLEG